MKYWQKIMKRILFFICTMVLLSSCGASGRAARTAEEAAERAAIVQAIEQADFILDVNHIIPQGFPAKSTTGEYVLRLKGDVVTTRLPFIGVSREATYAGVDEISIVFEDEKVDLRRDFRDTPKRAAPSGFSTRDTARLPGFTPEPETEKSTSSVNLERSFIELPHFS